MAPRMGAPIRSHVAGTGRNAAGDAAAAAENHAAIQPAAPALTPEQARIQQLQSIRGTMTSPFMGEFLGMFAGGGLAWVAGKLNATRVQTVIHAVFSAPFKALRETTLGTWYKFPSHYMKEVSGHAADASRKAIERHAMKAGIISKTTENVADAIKDIKPDAAKGAFEAQRWADKAASVEQSLMAKGEALNKGIVESGAVKSLRSRLGNMIDGIEKSAIGSKVHGVFDALMHNRSAAAVTKHTKHLAKIESALQSEPVGFFKSIGNFFKGIKPATIPTDKNHLSPFIDSLKAAADTVGADKVTALNTIKADLEAAMRGNALPKEVLPRAENVIKSLKKALSSAEAVSWYEGAKGESLRTMVKAVGKAVGRVPVFSAIVGVGAVAGLGATYLSAKAESKEAKNTYQDLLAEVDGRADSGFMQAVRAAHKSQGKGHVVKTGMELVGGVADGAFMVLPGGGGAAMMGALMLPQLCGMLVPDNQVLGAYAALKKHDKGQLELKPSQRIDLTKQLIAVMPNVASHGGIYNRLVTPIAAEIHERKLNASQIVELLSNDTKFAALAAEVSAKQQAIAAKAAEGKKALVEGKASHVAAGKAEATNDAKGKAEVAYLAAEKPGKPAGAVTHAGTVASAELKRA